MHPTLRDGDYIIALKYFNNHFLVGDIVIAAHPIYQDIIKRIQAIDENGNYWLVGDGTDTLSTATMGAIPPAALRGKMLFHIKAKQ